MIHSTPKSRTSSATNHRLVIAFLCLLGFLQVGSAHSDTQDKILPKDQALRTQLDLEIHRVLDSNSFRNVEVGISIASAGGDYVLVEYNPDQPFILASVTKIFTSAVALARYGADFHFTTEISASAKIVEGVLNGDIYLKGGGDPSLKDTHLRRAAKYLKSRLTEISGDIVYDDSLMDVEKPRYPPNARHLYTPPSALTVNHNWIVIGYEVGPPPKLWTMPKTGYARLHYNVRFSSSQRPGRPRMTYREEKWGDRYDIEGTVSRWDRKYKVLRLCVSRPGLYAGTLFKEACEAEGIRISGGVRRGSVPKGSDVIHSITTESLPEILTELNRESNNVVAELVSKNLGARFLSNPGTREKGVRVISSYCQDHIGLAEGSFSLADASGLSPENWMSSKQVTRALNSFYSDLGESFWTTLAPQGHHPHAMNPVPPRGMKMWVKSGTLPASGVNTVAGYVFLPAARKTYSFAILCRRKKKGPPAYSGTFTIPLMNAMVRAFDRGL